MRYRLHVSSCAVVLAAILAAAGPAVASTFLEVDVPQLRRMSEAVVHGNVVEARSYWNADSTLIFTDVALAVKGRLHGTSEDLIVLTLPGGEVDGFRVEMIGGPVIKTGEEVVVFVSRWKDGRPMVAGYEKGVSRVTRDAVGNIILQGGLMDGAPMTELRRQLRVSQ